MYILSICIPTFNRVSLLERTLLHLLEDLESNLNIEIIISDNSSTDNTQEICFKYCSKYSFIKYIRNNSNLGLDCNAMLAIKNSSSEYCWLLSDDDIPVKGTIARIIDSIKLDNPNLIYLNYTGIIESDLNSVDFSTDKKLDEKFIDLPEEMLVKYLISHFSATVVERNLFLKYETLLEKYRQMGFERGYILCLVDHMLLKERGTSVFLGDVSLITRNPESLIGNNYNPLSIVIDVARHYKYLYDCKLISAKTKSIVINRYLRGFYNIIIPIRLNYNDYYISKYVNDIHRTCFRYKNYYFFNLPFMLMPNFMLKYLYKFYLLVFKN